MGITALFALACSSKNSPLDPHNGHQVVPLDSAVQELTSPTNQEITSTTSTITAQKGMRVFPVKVTGRINYDNRNNTSLSSRVSGRMERLWIKYNYQPIRKGQLLFEVYSPDLVSAQRELLMLQQNKQEQLIPSAVQKLHYLGMHPNQIQQVLKSNTPLYRIPVYSPTSGYILEKAPSNNSLSVANSPIPSNVGSEMDVMGSGTGQMTASSTVNTNSTQPLLLREGQYVAAGQRLFSIYTNTNRIAEFALPPSLVSYVKRGKKILFQRSDVPNKSYQAEVGLIQPTFNAGENFSAARVYLEGNHLPVGQLINGTIAITIKDSFWLPKQAVIALGNQHVLFKKKEGNTFQPVPVQMGFSTEKEVQVLTDIGGWQIARNASYLVDSEDFILTTKSN